MEAYGNVYTLVRDVKIRVKKNPIFYHKSDMELMLHRNINYITGIISFLDLYNF